MSFYKLKNNPYKETKEFLEEAAYKSINLPLQIISKLFKFRNNGNKDGFLHFQEISQENNLMNTPLSNNDVINKKTIY